MYGPHAHVVAMNSALKLNLSLSQSNYTLCGSLPRNVPGVKSNMS